MSEENNSAFPRSIRSLIDIWPVLLVLFSLTIAGAQATAKIGEHEIKLERIDQTAATGADRLARMEERVNATQKQLDRIESKLDEALGDRK